MLILDSDHLSFLEWGGPESMRLRERLAEYPEKTVAVSIISYEEQMRGWMAYIARARSISARVHSDGVVLETGEELRAKAVVVATESPAAAELLGDPILGDPIASSGQGVTCFYFSAPRSPIDKPILILNGDGRGPINNMCVQTIASRSYGPRDRSLISVTTLKTTSDPNSLRAEVLEQLRDWFGVTVADWSHLRTYAIPYALPTQFPPALSIPERPVQWQPGIFVCGDHQDNASIQGAMISGRRVAEAIIKDCLLRRAVG